MIWEGRGLFERFCFLVVAIGAFGGRRCWIGGLGGRALVPCSSSLFFKKKIIVLGGGKRKERYYEYLFGAFGNCQKGSAIFCVDQPLRLRAQG